MSALRALIALNLDGDLVEAILDDEDGEEPIGSVAVFSDRGFTALGTGPQVSDPLALKSTKPVLKRMNETERDETVRRLLLRFVHEESVGMAGISLL
jgi:hypothetical protein